MTEEETIAAQDLLQDFPCLVAQRCDTCGTLRYWQPTGIATLPQWIAHFTELLDQPYACTQCQTTA